MNSPALAPAPEAAAAGARPHSDIRPPDIESLVSPLGVVAKLQVGAVPRGLNQLATFVTSIGSGIPGRGRAEREIQGFGMAVGAPDHARLVAVAEAAERYSSADFLVSPVIWSTLADLDGPTIDVTRLPRCSEREYSDPGCPFVPFDPSAEIRWVRGVDLATAAEVWVPAVMACYRLGNVRRQEGFWYRISTGCAVHTDPVEALVRGICEVAERDAAATIWLQQLSIPPLPARGTDWMSREVEYLLDWCGRHFIDARLFDATTDIGVPTAYCYLAAHSDSEVRQVLGCSSSRTMSRAAEKVLLETLLSRSLLCGTGELPASFKDYAALEHSARYMAYPERSGAFDFLVKDSGERPSRPLVRLPDDPGEALRHLISVLTAKGMQVVAVDRTTSELATAGLTSVSVLIPDLQPMALFPLGQFRAHRRLTTAPAAMGYLARREEEMNPWPQPFV
jgi:ribosomal protein S12 methylthiotransferase accessory factor